MKTKMLSVTLVLFFTSIGLADLSDGLVAYYPFNGNANDESSNGNHGVENGGPSYVGGVCGEAISLDGLDDYVIVADSPELDLVGDFSISLWMDPKSYSYYQGGNVHVRRIIVKHHRHSNNEGNWYSRLNQDGRLSFHNVWGTGEGYYIAIFTNSAIPLNEWSHVGLTYSKSDKKFAMYINGLLDVERNNVDFVLRDTPRPLLIGLSEFYSEPFDGLMDEVRIYNRALFEDEIRDLGSCAVSVDIDIKPGSCPNPLNVKNKGVLPVAILGSADFDVIEIDTASIRLANVAPIRSSYEDVATPLSNKVDACDCTTEGPDGYLDLTLKFKIQDIVDVLGEVNDGDVLQLSLTGTLIEDFGGTPIEGADCVVIISKGGKNE